MIDTDVIVIGTGFSGIGMGAQLRRDGHRNFVILERADEVGGTWRDNTYPGVACDIPAPVYSFSWAMNPRWTAYYPPGREIHQYLARVARDEGLYPHIRFRTPMEEARWDPHTERWIVRTPAGSLSSKWLILGAGRLVEPNTSGIRGLEGFPGHVLHSARWNHDVDLAGARVAVAGTGASAAQIIPELARTAGDLVVFQRTPAWVVPRQERVYPPATQRMFERAPEAMRRERDDIFWYAESQFAQRRAVPAALEGLKQLARGHLAGAIADPVLREQLTPHHDPGCKRVLFSNTYYPALAQDNVRLEPHALAELDGSVAVSAGGARHEIDALVLCTGFEVARPPFADLVHAGDGRTLAQHWSTGMAALNSTAVAGFPNLFVLNGPNASVGHNSIVYIIESQVQYVLEALERADRDGLRTIVATAPAQQAYVDELQDRAGETVFLRNGGCHSWYVDPRSGRLTATWPDYAYAFRAQNGHFSGAGFVARRADGEEVAMTVEP